MKKILLSVAMLCMALGGRAETQSVCEGWPADYDGVMLQGFWWDGYEAAKWSALEAKAGELSQYFDLIWIPNSGTVGGNYETTQGKSMGYDPCYWLHHNSYFGTEEELIHMIQTYKDLGVGIIEDVVINHKKGVSDWLDFAQELAVIGHTTGKAYTVKWNNETASEICCTDDCNYAPEGNYHTTGSYDTGDDFPGFRDLDHTSATTQKNVKTYLDFLLNELGYAGFRYDLVKGYGAGFIQTYNNSAMPTFSVGEYWDGTEAIKNWIRGTNFTSAAFDFPLKYALNAAISNGRYEALADKSFTYDAQFKRYSVTFADNHDSGREDHSKLVNNWSAANAFILASPGTPCVWYPHYLADPVNIRAMILARKACGITNTNCYVEQQEAVNNNTGYILKTVGHSGSVYVQFGSAVGDTPYGYELVAQGDGYKFYSSKADFASMTVSPNVGFFTTETLDVTLTPVKANTNMAWYSFNADGTGKTYINEATTIRIGENASLNSDITIYWGAKGADNNEYTGSATFTKRNLYEPSASNGEECVFFETEANKVSIWAWNEDSGTNYTGGSWDDKPCIDVPMGVNEAGKLIYKWNKPANIDGSPTKIIFVTDDSQTDNLDYVNHGYYNASGIVYHLGTNTVKFDNSVGNWENVYYYAWDNNKHAKAAWPGEKITTTTDGYYQVTLDGVYPNIIFNDGSSDASLAGLNKTEDLVAVDGKVYSLGSNKVSFDNSQSQWNSVYCYAYANETVHNQDWPGVPVSATEGNLIEVTLPAAYTYVIFNDGTIENSIVGENKTGDLAVVDGMVYALGANTISYDNSKSAWENVYCHAYTADNKPRMAWPGERLVADEHGKYVITLPDVFTGVVFNDGNGGVVGVSQTADLDVENNQEYALKANTVYYDNSDTQWEDVYYYAYTDNEVWKVAWPGEKLTANTKGSNEDVYEVSLLEGYTHVIFNNGNGGVGTNQTENLDVEDGKTYRMEVAEIDRLRIAGSFTEWASGAVDMIAGDNYTWTYSLDLSDIIDDVQFKLIVNDNGWMGFNNLNITAPNGWVESYGNDANIMLWNSKTGIETYLLTATWSPSANATDGWSLKIVGVEPRYENTYTVAGSSVDLLGTEWDPNNTNNDMILGHDGSYYYLTKVASDMRGSYQFKVVKNHDWNEGSYGDNGQNILFSIDTDDLVEVSFYYHPIDDHVTYDIRPKSVLEIVDGEPFNAAGNFTVPAATYSRAFKNNWGTLCLPFEINKSYDGVTFYQLGAVDTENKVLTFTEMTTSVAAGQPVVYKAEDGVDLFIYEEGNVAVSATPETVSLTTADDVVWSLEGSFAKLTNFNPESLCLYYIANNKFWLGNNTTILAYRAYFTTTDNFGEASVGAPYRIEVGDPEDIQVVEQEDGSVKVYYDLQGRRLGNARKGLVIVNGKLIFVK